MTTFRGILALFLWSLGALFASILHRIPPWEFFAILWGTGSLCTYFHLYRKKRLHILRELPWDGWMISIFFALGNQLAFALSYRLAPPEQIDLINYSWPLLVLSCVGFIPGERFSLRMFTAAGIGFYGVYMLLKPDLVNAELRTEHLPGYLTALFASVGWAGYILYSRKKSHYPCELLCLAMPLGALLALYGHRQYEQYVAPTLIEWAALIFWGGAILSTSYWLWDEAVKRGNFQLLNVLSYFTPLVSVNFLLLFGYVKASPTLVVAYVLVVAGTLLGIMRQQQEAKAALA